MPSHSRRPALGFTLVEVMVALSIVAILAMIAVPSIQDRIVREQVVEAAKLADDVVKGPIATYWRVNNEMPADNDEADVPAAAKIVGNFVSAVTVEDGAIHITFGNNANGAIKGRTLTLRPAVVPDTPKVPPAWVCAAGGKVPDKMEVQGRDRTDIENRYLPVNCRRPGG
ncbi:MAG TPA: pilin [Ideonella sp.]|uniref:pilin n=1 Tax=Ideonella sp. TaxID=1929293 RepID=UPI002E3522F3|nr:pilin [Ideonella sp.]HEX5682836.1 pilin [Ideonella sp.]